MLFLKASYGDIIRLTDTENGDELIAALTIRGLETVQGIDLFNIAIDSSRRFKITKTMIKDQFSFSDGSG